MQLIAPLEAHELFGFEPEALVTHRGARKRPGYGSRGCRIREQAHQAALVSLSARFELKKSQCFSMQPVPEAC
jgi:hypothetical protein